MAGIEVNTDNFTRLSTFSNTFKSFWVQNNSNATFWISIDGDPGDLDSVYPPTDSSWPKLPVGKDLFVDNLQHPIYVLQVSGTKQILTTQNLKIDSV